MEHDELIHPLRVTDDHPLLSLFGPSQRRIGLYLSYFAEGFFEYLPPTGFAEFGPSTANVWAAAARSRGTAGAAAKTRQQANRRITYSRNNLMANMRELVDASTAFAAFSAGLYINANPDAANPFLTQLPQRTVAGGQGTFGRPTQLG